MKTYNNLYPKICNLNNLILAWRKARKHKTKKDYVIDFESNLTQNLLRLHEELKNQIYKPLPLKTFIYDSCANRKDKGNLFALNRLDKFMRKFNKNKGILITKKEEKSIKVNEGEIRLIPAKISIKRQF